MVIPLKSIIFQVNKSRLFIFFNHFVLNGKLVHDEKKNSDCSLSGREVLSGLILLPLVCGLGLRVIQGLDGQERRASERGVGE